MRRVRPSRPAPAYSFSTLRLNQMLTHGIPPDFLDGVHMYRQPPSGQSQVYRATQLRTNDVHCRESAGTGPVALKVVVPVTGAAFAGHHGPIINSMCVSFLFPKTTNNNWYEVGMCVIRKYRRLSSFDTHFSIYACFLTPGAKQICVFCRFPVLGPF